MGAEQYRRPFIGTQAHVRSCYAVKKIRWDLKKPPSKRKDNLTEKLNAKPMEATNAKT